MATREYNMAQMFRASLGLDGHEFLAAGETKDLSTFGETRSIFCIVPQFSGETVLLDATSTVEVGEAVPDLLAATEAKPLFGPFSKVVLDATSDSAICYYIIGKARA